MSVKKVREEDSQGHVIYKETSSDMVVREDGTKVEDGLKEAEAPTFDDSGTVSGINSFQTFYQSIVSKMPFINFLRNFKAGLNFIVNTGQIVNNGTTNQPGYALDARQRNPNIEGTLAYEVSQLTNGLDAMALDYSDYTMEGLLSANPSYSRPRIGYIGWDSAIAPPDKNTTLLFILNGNIAAFTMNGYFYTVHEPSTEWELRYKPVN